MSLIMQQGRFNVSNTIAFVYTCKTVRVTALLNDALTHIYHYSTTTSPPLPVTINKQQVFLYKYYRIALLLFVIFALLFFFFPFSICYPLSTVKMEVFLYEEKSVRELLEVQDVVGYWMMFQKFV